MEQQPAIAQKASFLSYDLQLRLWGFAGVAAAAVLGWFFLWTPLQRARAGVPEIEMIGKAAYVGAPLMLVFGLAFLLGGEGMKYRDTSTDPPRLTGIGWVILLLATALGIGTFLWMEAQFTALGYTS